MLKNQYCTLSNDFFSSFTIVHKHYDLLKMLLTFWGGVGIKPVIDRLHSEDQRERRLLAAFAFQQCFVYCFKSPTTPKLVGLIFVTNSRSTEI